MYQKDMWIKSHTVQIQQIAHEYTFIDFRIVWSRQLMAISRSDRNFSLQNASNVTKQYQVPPARDKPGVIMN